MIDLLVVDQHNLTANEIVRVLKKAEKKNVMFNNDYTVGGRAPYLGMMK